MLIGVYTKLFDCFAGTLPPPIEMEMDLGTRGIGTVAADGSIRRDGKAEAFQGHGEHSRSQLLVEKTAEFWLITVPPPSASIYVVSKDPAVRFSTCRWECSPPPLRAAGPREACAGGRRGGQRVGDGEPEAPSAGARSCGTPLEIISKKTRHIAFRVVYQALEQ